MKFKHAASLTVIILLTCFSLAFSSNNNVSFQDNNDTTLPFSNGLYIEPYLGYGYVNALHSAVRRHGLSGGLAVGYKATESWAVELGYTQLPSANISTHYLYTALNYLFITKSYWDLFFKLGPAYVQGSRDPLHSASHRLALLAGFGSTYWMSQSLGLIGQMALTTQNGNIPLTFNLTLGLSYFF